MISQSGRSVKIRLLVQVLVKILGSSIGHFVTYVRGVGASEALDHMQGVAVWMTDGVETGAAVEVNGIHDECVAVPVSD